MKIIGLLLFIFLVNVSLAQNDTIPHDKNLSYKFDSILKTNIPIYNYSNIWDFDGDKINDSLWFIGNGGAHAYYYLRIKLSSIAVAQNFPCVQIDMPFLTNFENFALVRNSPAIQFVVHDFDNDGLNEIYLNIVSAYKSCNNCNLKKDGIKTPYLLVDVKNNKLVIQDY